MICTRASSYLEKITSSNKILLLFLFSVFLFCIKDGPIISPDSGTYINHSIFRMGLYPLSLSLFLSLFKGSAFEVLVGCQLVFSLIASYCLATFLFSTFTLPPAFRWVLISVFLIPIVVLKSANDILSEGLAYPLFLLTSYFFLKGILLNNIKDLYKFTLVAYLLVLTRQQYLFFYGVALVALVYLIIFQKKFEKKGSIFLSIILSLSAFFISERTYHLIFHDTFSGTPFAGIELIGRPLFTSTQDSFNAFEDPKQKLFVEKAVQNSINQNAMNADPNTRQLSIFEHTTNTIRFSIALPLLEQIWNKEDFDLERGRTSTEFEYKQYIDKQAVSISLHLIKSNFVNYITSYSKDIIRGFGGYAMFGLVFFASILFLWKIVCRKSMSVFYVFFILTALMHLGNLVIVCLVEPPILRYTYPTSLLLFTMLLIMVYQFSKSPMLTKSDALCAE